MLPQHVWTESAGQVAVVYISRDRSARKEHRLGCEKLLGGVTRTVFVAAPGLQSNFSLRCVTNITSQIHVLQHTCTCETVSTWTGLLKCSCIEIILWRCTAVLSCTGLRQATLQVAACCGIYCLTGLQPWSPPAHPHRTGLCMACILLAL